MIRLLTMQRGEDWLKNAEKEFKTAKAKDATSGTTLLLHGGGLQSLPSNSTGQPKCSVPFWT